MNICSYIDHTLLKPYVQIRDIENLCKEAMHYSFAAVCVPPCLVKTARAQLDDTVKTATVIGFPLGYSCTEAKLAEVKNAIADGADELDIVINLVHLKNGEWRLLENEMCEVLTLSHKEGRILKVIIESGILSEEEIIHCCDLYGRLGVDFLKTSTGYAEKGATVRAVKLMREQLPPSVKIKASGGIRTYEFARDLVKAGADRLGCSASVEIAKGETNK